MSDALQTQPETPEPKFITEAELCALEDSHPLHQRWITPDGGYRFGKSPYNGPTYYTTEPALVGQLGPIPSFWKPRP
jgi:hypothetical protein